MYKNDLCQVVPLPAWCPCSRSLPVPLPGTAPFSPAIGHLHGLMRLCRSTGHGLRGSHLAVGNKPRPTPAPSPHPDGIVGRGRSGLGRSLRKVPPRRIGSLAASTHPTVALGEASWEKVRPDLAQIRRAGMFGTCELTPGARGTAAPGES